MTAARILVVDDDLWIQRTTASVLGHVGHQVSLAGDAPSAFAIASKIRPDLVVTTVTLPALEGWSWWERLRALPACADLSILFLVPATEPPIPGEGPHDRRLRKPFRVEDLERAVVSVLGSRPVAEVTVVSTPEPPARQRSVDPTKPSAGHRPLSAFRGELDQISLASVLTVLEMESKTGMLLIEGPHGTARVCLRRGRVIRAGVDAAGLDGTGAIYALLTWQRGSFDFLAGDIGGIDEIQTSTTFLLMEGARRLDEANEARRLQAERGKL